jgi:protein-tyrosine phosphatase
MEARLEDRIVAFEACFNFRDLGGYQTRDGRHVRWGRLFRSDTLHRLTTSDVATLGGLGLRTVVDLRTITELDDYGSLPVSGRVDVAWHHVPIFDGVMRLQPRSAEELAAMPVATEPTAPGRSYLDMLGDGNGIARVLALLTGPDATRFPRCR